MMNKKRLGKIAVFEIFNLVLAIVAFSFLVSFSAGVVSGFSLGDLNPFGWFFKGKNNLNAPVSGANAPIPDPVNTGGGKQVVAKVTDDPTFKASGSWTTGSGLENVGIYKPEPIIDSKLSSLTTPGGTSTGLGGAAGQAGGAGLSSGINIGSKVTLGEFTGTLGQQGGNYVITDASGKLLTQVPKDQLGSLKSAAGTNSPGTQPQGLLKSLQANTILSSLFWSASIAGLVALAAGFFGVSGNNQKALFVATFAGAMTYQLVTPILSGAGWNIGGASNVLRGNAMVANPQIWGFGIALGVGLLILNMMWSKESKKLVTFQCLPYEAPVGGQYCELCNKDKFRPCSEYRCKSLGQACELLNAGTENEMCAWVNRQDVTSPTIAPFEEVLTTGHQYKDVKTRPPGTGMRIVKTSASDGCIKAFTPLVFGISTNEPTQCKIDYNHTTNIRDVKNAYSSMTYYFGESSLYAYNHTQTLRLPGQTTVNSTGGVELIHDGTFTLYTRCQDANGNVNEDEFAIRFCVEKGPDTTPARIEGTSIPNGYPVLYGLNETAVEVYVNEPADCKWSRQDKNYELMENTMSCSRNVFDMNSNMVYTCLANLNGLENRKDNEFYFRCKDQPNLDFAGRGNDRIVNQESYKFVLKGTQPVNILKTGPNGTIQGYANVVSVDLDVVTGNGYNKGEAICYYSQTNTDESFIKMFEQKAESDGYHNRQNQQLAPGTWTYYFKCIDLGGNTDYNSTTFTVQVDRQAPVVVRVYNEGNNLKIVTDEKSSCSYSQTENQKCNFEIANGKSMLYSNTTEHYTEWQPNTNYYIKCSDVSGNQPNPVDCSIIVRPYTSLK